MSYQRPIVRVQKLHEHLGHKAPVFGLCEDNKGNFFSASGDGLIVRWDAQSLNEGKALFQANVSFYTVQILNQQFLACGASDGNAYFYNLKTRQFIKNSLAHYKSIFQFLPIHDNLFLSIGGDGMLTFWELPSLNPLKSIKISAESLRTAIYLPDYQWIIIGSSDSKIRVFHLQDLNLKLINEWAAHFPSVFSLIIIPNLPFLVSAGRDASIRIWNYEDSFQLVQEIPAHIQTINHLVLSPNSKYLLSGSMDKLLKIWDVQNDFRLIKVIDKNRNDSHTASINRILWLHYNDSVITASDDKKIIQWAIDFNPQEKE
jgi:WD40 repeat protein